MAENMNNTRPVQAAKPQARNRKAAKRVGLAALVVAILVPVLLAIRAITTSKNAKKNKKKVSKTYSRLANKVKRFLK